MTTGAKLAVPLIFVPWNYYHELPHPITEPIAHDSVLRYIKFIEQRELPAVTDYPNSQGNNLRRQPGNFPVASKTWNCPVSARLPADRKLSKRSTDFRPDEYIQH